MCSRLMGAGIRGGVTLQRRSAGLAKVLCSGSPASVRFRTYDGAGIAYGPGRPLMFAFVPDLVKVSVFEHRRIARSRVEWLIPQRDRGKLDLPLLGPSAVVT